MDSNRTFAAQSADDSYAASSTSLRHLAIKKVRQTSRKITLGQGRALGQKRPFLTGKEKAAMRLPLVLFTLTFPHLLIKPM
tara:strand:- start:1993 stop:2235 length:243 start_codon:yes stop_codon:yes gene_type:complete